MQRLAFYNTGPNQLPGVIVMSLSDLVEPDLDANHEFIVVLFNANDEAETISVGAAAGMDLHPHPLQAGLATGFDSATGTFNVPARTTAVFVDGATAPPVNLVQNGSFENGKEPWRLYTNARGRFLVTDDASAGTAAARIHVDAVGSNTQLYQAGITLAPNSSYILRFDAKANRPLRMRVYLHKHGAPYTNYGVRTAQIELTTSYQTYAWPFTTGNFTTPVDDGRLRFWLAPYAAPGDFYTIDNVTLVSADDEEHGAVMAAATVNLTEDEADLLAGGDVGPADAEEIDTTRILLPLIVR